MPAEKTMNNKPFVIKDCALIALASGIRAQNLRELKDRIQTIEPASIYYHFWGNRLRARFDDPEYSNDFASWSRHALHDRRTAEHLGAIDPTGMVDIEQLRQEVIEVVEERLDQSPTVPWAKAHQQFNFITSQMVVFTTKKLIREPKDLAKAVPAMSLGSIFYHFIDARQRTPDRTDDFSEWISGFEKDYADLLSGIANLDPYFPTLTEIRDQLSSIFAGHFGGSL